MKYEPLSFIAALFLIAALFGMVSYYAPTDDESWAEAPLVNDELLDESEAICIADTLYAEPRSSCWRKTRAEYLGSHPKCEFKGCKITKKLQVHHVIPFHTDEGKALECDLTNLIAACWAHHLWVAHCGSTRDYNPNVREDFKRGRWPKTGLMRFKEHEERKMRDASRVTLLAL